MAGHSKWANIKHRKGKADAKKGKIFSRCAKEIITAVKLAGPDREANTRLRVAIQKAKEANVPNDIIDRNIKKASSDDQAEYMPMTYELYGHGGVGILLDILTDNRNRISSDIRIATNKRGGVVATPGAVAFNFDAKGVLHIPSKGISEELLFEKSLELGADDFEALEDLFVIQTSPENLLSVKEAILKLGALIEQAEVEMVPKAYMACDEETKKANLALIEWLEGIDDVDALWHNMEL